MKDHPFVVRQNHFIVRRNHFIVRRNHFIVRQNHPMADGIISLSDRIIPQDVWYSYDLYNIT